MKVRILTALALAVQACTPRGPLTEAEAVVIANAYVVEQGHNLRYLHVGRVEDDGNTIRVDYDLNPDVQGGAPLVVIDKETRRVLRDEDHEQ